MTTLQLTYIQQLRHPNWQRRRLEIMQRDGFACQCCGETEETLNVHHKLYVKGRMAWEYSDTELATLCEPCHGLAHETGDAIKQLVAALPLDGPGGVSSAMSLVAGWANGQQGTDTNAYWQEDPANFSIGEIAAHLDHLNINDLFALANALKGTPPWVIDKAIQALTTQLIAECDTPEPPGYGVPEL